MKKSNKSNTLTKIEDAIYKYTIRHYSETILKNHITEIIGIENIPENGPYIIVANHSSFADHFIISGISQKIFGKKLIFLTKKESFETFLSRLWHNATGCIPVDREKPDMSTIKQIVSYIKEDKSIVIYPEGTRGQGDKLLDFKSGAFKIAALAKVPIVPIALQDAHLIMPKGERKFAPFKGKVYIGKPVSTKHIKEVGSEKILIECKNIIQKNVYEEQDLQKRALEKVNTSDYLVNKSLKYIEALLEEGIKPIHKKELQQVISMCNIAIINDPKNIQAYIQRARAYGLILLTLPKLSFLMKANKIPKLVKEITDLDPYNPFAKYILGSYFLHKPVIFGGNKTKAMTLISEAYINSKSYGIPQRTFMMTYIKSLIKNKQTKEAKELLSEFLVNISNEDNKRSLRRKAEAEQLLHNLSRVA